jgi:DNA-binding transcriptional ArsR family regulator
MSDIDIENMRIPTRIDGTVRKGSENKSLENKDQGYIKRMALNWTRRAGRFRGKSLLVGCELWFLVGVTKSRIIPYNLFKAARKLKMSRGSLSRGLTALEQAKLVRVDRKPGCKCVVEVLDI